MDPKNCAHVHHYLCRVPLPLKCGELLRKNVRTTVLPQHVQCKLMSACNVSVPLRAALCAVVNGASCHCDLMKALLCV